MTSSGLGFVLLTQNGAGRTAFSSPVGFQAAFGGFGGKGIGCLRQPPEHDFVRLGFVLLTQNGAGRTAFSSPVGFQAAFGGFGGKGIRTPGLLIANETLYQLSYTPAQDGGM
jgi:hypothetical protein